MIIDFALLIVSFLLNALAAILPSFQIFPATLAGQISDFIQSIYGWAWIFPVGPMMFIFLVIVFLVFAEFVFFTTMYVLSIIHSSVK